ncbi:MAG: CRTAC1 family protein [Armatimonadota bacterium]
MDEAKERGIDFVHHASDAKPLTIVETMGSAAVVLDFDGDGWQDILLVNAGQDFRAAKQQPASKLYRNTGDAKFVDVTAGSGLTIDGFATGACAGDYDNDGHVDIAVTGFHRSWLFRNRGGGKFEEVGRRAGLRSGPDAWGMGCAFLDVNRDGKLDLYIANYVRYDPAIPYCTTANVKHGCTPNQYHTQSNELYVNRGDGTFVDRTQALGAADPDGAGLGVVACDLDNDGWMDIFVANDGTPNGLLHNRGGRFDAVGQQAGVAFGDDGTMRAGMGTDAGDFDGDGLFDLSITNFQNEVTAVYRNEGAMMFAEVSSPTGVGAASMNHLKFGVAWVDLDLDGRIDLYQGNGHVHDNIREFNDTDTFEQVDQVYRNLGGGRFAEVLPATGAFPANSSVTRAVASGDFDNDGRSDLVINSLNRPARLLMNRTPSKGHWIGLRLKGTKGNASAVGARVEATIGGELQVREVRSGSGYLGQNDFRVLFRVPAGADAAKARIVVRWPDGRSSTPKGFAIDQYSEIAEGDR